MRDVQLLNAATHADLRLGAPAGSERWQGFVELALPELSAAADRYPLFLAKNADTGRFAVGMLHGIKAGEPIRPDREATRIGFLPAALARQGFYAVGQDLGVDLGDPRLGATDGRPLFEADGRPAAALKEVQRAVALLKTARQATDAFVAALLEHGLVEAVDVTLDFDDAERLTLNGLYTVSLDRVNALGDAAVLSLFRADQLRLAFCIAESLPRLATLARERNGGLAS